MTLSAHPKHIYYYLHPPPLICSLLMNINKNNLGENKKQLKIFYIYNQVYLYK